MRRLLPVLILLTSAAWSGGRPIPILFDTDIGGDIDDALALALALQSPELDVRGVTTVSDDTIQRTRLAWKELGLYGRQDIPLATGARDGLFKPGDFRPPGQYKALTGADVAPRAALERRAAEFLVETLLRSPEKLTLVPVGPLTNIALALKLEPAIKPKIERIVLMGGAFNLLKAEYNIVRDSAAAEIVFQSGVPITAVGLDVTMQCRLEGRDLDRIRDASSPSAAFLWQLIEFWRNRNPNQYPILHDPLAVAVVFLPDLVETSAGHVTVEYASPVTDGITLFRPDNSAGAKGSAATLVARKVNARRFLDLFVERISSNPRAR
ncbi:MAG: nucleoside hydrolase [Acidobacteria bacterium]|nr:nucleoside hydrolase [Acidobacteriota bacterium]